MNSSSKTGIRTKRAEEALAFLEQLTWLIESKGRRLDLDFLRQLLMDYEDRSGFEDKLSPSVRKFAKNYIAENPDKHFLVGALPSLLQDEKLFPSNKDIAEFSGQFMGIPVSRFEKRSRYEMIGLVVCAVNDLSKTALNRIATRLSSLVGNERLLFEIAEEKARNAMFSWNDVIRRFGK